MLVPFVTSWFFGPKTQLLGMCRVAAVLGFVTFAGRRVSKSWRRGEPLGALPASLPFSAGKSGVGSGSGLTDVADMDCSPSAIDDLMKEVSPEHKDWSEVKYPKILGTGLTCVLVAVLVCPRSRRGCS